MVGPPDGPRRRGPFRERRYTILVVAGATSTEYRYFDAFRPLLSTSRVCLDVQKHSAAPDQVVRATAAIRRRKPDAHDEAWAVVDVDNFQNEGRKIDQAVVRARRERIQLAISNPCFELWMILHHVAWRAYVPDCAAAERHLTRLMRRKYDKTNVKIADHLRLADFEAHLNEIVKRAKDLDPTGRDHDRNPTTTVCRLVERILEKA